MEIFVAHRYHNGTHPGLPGLPQTDEEFYKNSEQLKAVNYCHKQLHLRCCSSFRSTSGMRVITIMHPIVEKWSAVWSVAARNET